MGKRGGSSGFTSGQGGNATAPAEKKESLAEYKGKVDRLINGAQGAGGFSQQKEREFKAFLGDFYKKITTATIKLYQIILQNYRTDIYKLFSPFLHKNT